MSATVARGWSTASRFVTAAIILVAASITASPAASADPVTAAVERAYGPLLDRYDVPGIAVAVTIHGRQHFFDFGVASKHTRAPVTRDTLFEIGSVSKTLTATLAGYAAARGAMDLGDRFQPTAAGAGRDGCRRGATPQSGTYTAGGLALQFPESVTDDDQVIAYFQRFRPTAAPGELRQYSNPSIGLLGRIAARSLHGDFTRLLESQIMPGLG